MRHRCHSLSQGISRTSTSLEMPGGATYPCSLVGKPNACGGGTVILLPSGMSAKAQRVVHTSPLFSPAPDHLSGIGHPTRRTRVLAHGPTAFKTRCVTWRNQTKPPLLFWPLSLRDVTRIYTQVSFIVSDAHYNEPLW